MTQQNKQLTFITVASCIGSMLEMYDFVIYVIFASVISGVFFPHATHYVAIMQTFGIFAIGYFARPLGGIIFGHIGDKYGRQKGLVLSVMCMGIPTFLIGCLPTYEAIGALAPQLLLVLRFISGISVGGEFPSGTAYLTEHAPVKYRGFIASFLFLGINAGILLASLVGSVITNSMPSDAIAQWGWRIPFLLGGVLAVLAYVVRLKLLESPLFEKHKSEQRLAKSPVLSVLHNNSRQITRAFSVVSVMAAAISILFLFMPVYLSEHLKLPLGTALSMNSLNLLVFTLLIPIFARLSDLTSRNFIISIGAYLFLFLSIPLYMAIIEGDAGTRLLAMMSLGVICATVVGPIAATLAERFTTQERTSGIGLSYNLSFGLVGGLAPLAVTFLIHRTHMNVAPAFYLMLTAAITLMAAINLKDYTRKPMP
tara:strand:- start:96016 stop:97290 length:1275 start_codon:yes stop_codon:yes gene_type:complete